MSGPQDNDLVDTQRATVPEPTTKRVVLGVTGSVAAFKAVELARLLLKAGVQVVPMMTRSAKQFLGEATLAGLCGQPVRVEMFEHGGCGEAHIELGAADLVVLAPATADLIASMAQGRASDLVRAAALCARNPVLLAPAMHPRMWSHPATQRNVQQLLDDGRVELVGPVHGEVANGEVGLGRMAEPDAIAAAALARVNAASRDLAGLRVVVTAGPTIEDIDPARFLSNRSSGKMGYAVAEQAVRRGAEVTLLSGPVVLPAPQGVRFVQIRSAAELREALWTALGTDLSEADVLVMSAAVADYRPAERHEGKMKRADSPDGLTLQLLPNPDLLAEVGAARSSWVAGKSGRPLLVGFALETLSGDELIAAARRKLEAKGVDLVVANHADDSFDKDDNQVVLVSAKEAEPLARASKHAIADQLLNRICATCVR